MTVAVVDPAELAGLIKQAVAEAIADLEAPRSEVLSTKELAQALDVSEELIRHYAREHADFPCIRVGRKKLRFRLADVVAWFEGRDAA